MTVFSLSSISQVALYTSLYHAYCAPSRYTEPAGRVYRGMDDKIHDRCDRSYPKLINQSSIPLSIDSGAFEYYSDLSLWDVFRTQLPWLALTVPNVSRDIMQVNPLFC